MAELLGLGCSHGPIILTPPEVWAKGPGANIRPRAGL